MIDIHPEQALTLALPTDHVHEITRKALHREKFNVNYT